MFTQEAGGADPSLQEGAPLETREFSILDIALVEAPNMKHLQDVSIGTRDGEHILRTVLEETGVVPTTQSATESEDLKSQRTAALTQVARAADWYRVSLFDDYRDKKKTGLNTDALAEIFDLTEPYEETSPILTIIGQLARSLPDYVRDGVYEADRIARVMILDEKLHKQ